MDLGVSSVGRKKVNALTASYIIVSLYLASVEASAPRALTSQQPAIQPSVAIARIGPNSFLASASRAKTIVEEMLHVGDEQSAWSWINASTSHGCHLHLTAVLASTMARAVARVRLRRTFTGDAW